jgi:hypothetical protein
MQERPAPDEKRPHCEISYFFLFAAGPFDALCLPMPKINRLISPRVTH